MNSMVQTDIQVKSYDASDVSEGYALAYEQVSDLAVMIDEIKHCCEKNIEYAAKVYDIPDIVFRDLRRLFAITDGIITDNLEFSKHQEDTYQKEYDQKIDIQ